jgi:hypothetical protein
VGPIYYQLAFGQVGQATTLIASGCMLILTGMVCAIWLRQRPR